MKLPCCTAAAFVVTALVAGCASPGANPISGQTTWPGQPGTNAYMLHAPDETSSAPPRLTVGTSYPDTQLILPWFLNDIIDFVNYR
ncbi:MAG TPA: hypothetical protein VGG24_05275 [Paraburkholderia sp.]